MKKILIMLLFLGGCVTTPATYNPVAERQLERHYDSRGRYSGYTRIKIYKDGSVVKEHFDKKGKYIGRSRIN